LLATFNLIIKSGERLLLIFAKLFLQISSAASVYL